MTVFDIFKNSHYTYLSVSQSRIAGDVVASERADLLGVFKAKGGMVQTGDRENMQASPILYVRPDDFNIENPQELVGNGVRVGGQDYAIAGATAGYNYHIGQLEHYRLTLSPAVLERVNG